MKYKKKKIDMLQIPKEDRNAIGWLSFKSAPEIINVEKIDDCYVVGRVAFPEKIFKTLYEEVEE